MQPHQGKQTGAKPLQASSKLPARLLRDIAYIGSRHRREVLAVGAVKNNEEIHLIAQDTPVDWHIIERSWTVAENVVNPQSKEKGQVHPSCPPT
jgi:hypothetical protein